jgi:hypothetical protein
MKGLISIALIVCSLSAQAAVYRVSGSYITVVNEAKQLQSEAETAITTGEFTENLKSAIEEFKDEELCDSELSCLLKILE